VPQEQPSAAEGRIQPYGLAADIGLAEGPIAYVELFSLSSTRASAGVYRERPVVIQQLSHHSCIEQPYLTVPQPTPTGTHFSGDRWLDSGLTAHYLVTWVIKRPG
jgi:hypothetical protein